MSRDSSCRSHPQHIPRAGDPAPFTNREGTTTGPFRAPSWKTKCGLEVARNRAEGTRDALRERKDGAHDERGDHCKDDAVLRHRLTLLDTEAGAKVSNEICDCHCLIHPLRELELHPAPFIARSGPERCPPVGGSTVSSLR